MCAGRIREDKGQEILVKASIDLLKNNKNWALAIVGKVDDFEFLKVLQDLIVRNSISTQVYFIDETLDIVSYYQASKIVVVPSFTEGFSLVCAEAMACGKTVIATKNVGIHSQIIQNRHSGYLFDVGNSQELASILKDLITTKLPYVGINAESEINNNWSSKIEAKALYNLYRELL
ncbi:glycosyltransferase [Tenacibaculum sp. SG-28]|uniref:glycosyltransferase n=1 Tax=Tenacibaculum sp. SG-28 TaxID=754426 RepID=UPI001E53430C|nr:glycosyltransferase [Tenacibaculum sp. SG-28]